MNGLPDRTALLGRPPRKAAALGSASLVLTVTRQMRMRRAAIMTMTNGVVMKPVLVSMMPALVVRRNASNERPAIVDGHEERIFTGRS